MNTNGDTPSIAADLCLCFCICKSRFSHDAVQIRKYNAIFFPLLHSVRGSVRICLFQL